LYKKQDDEARSRGEVPPSILRKADREFPIILDDNKKVRSVNMKDQLWNMNVTLPLAQLLYHSPDLKYQCITLLGGQPTSTKKKPKKEADPMEVDREEGHKGTVQNIQLDTSTQLQNTSLQAVLVLVEEMQLEFLIDGGAVVSVIPLRIVERLGKRAEIEPTNKTLKFGDGKVEVPVGLVKLWLKFSKDVKIRHTFCVTKNISTPLMLCSGKVIKGSNKTKEYFLRLNFI
jgi:hypothetical protein